MRKMDCTLSDEELLAAVKSWITKLCESRGKDWLLSIPAQPDKDPDLLIMELHHRYGNIIEGGPARMLINALRESVEKEGKGGNSWYFAYQSNIAMPFVDCYMQQFPETTPEMRKQVHEIANKAAMWFLDLFLAPTPEPMPQEDWDKLNPQP
ncbi:MAG: hypothetical protein QM762_12560 [Chryseolinea sp.]